MYVSKRCFFTKSPRTDRELHKMMKCPNVVKTPKIIPRDFTSKSEILLGRIDSH